jgi:hypothetical protein
MGEWLTWLEPILRYLARNISKPTVMDIDHNDLVETRELVQECFADGWKSLRTVTGGRIFMRGEFSWESGYWGDDSGMNFADGGMGDDWSDCYKAVLVSNSLAVKPNYPC